MDDSSAAFDQALRLPSIVDASLRHLNHVKEKRGFLNDFQWATGITKESLFRGLYVYDHYGPAAFFPIDFFHTIFLNITKKLAFIFFQVGNDKIGENTGFYGVGALHIRDLNQLLLSITPLNKGRKIKAIELAEFSLFTYEDWAYFTNAFVPLLKGGVDSFYIDLIQLYSSIVHRCLQQEVVLQDLPKLHFDIQNFIARLEKKFLTEFKRPIHEISSTLLHLLSHSAFQLDLFGSHRTFWMAKTERMIHDIKESTLSNSKPIANLQNIRYNAETLRLYRKCQDWEATKDEKNLYPDSWNLIDIVNPTAPVSDPYAGFKLLGTTRSSLDASTLIMLRDYYQLSLQIEDLESIILEPTISSFSKVETPSGKKFRTRDYEFRKSKPLVRTCRFAIVFTYTSKLLNSGTVLESSVPPMRNGFNEYLDLEKDIHFHRECDTSSEEDEFQVFYDAPSEPAVSTRRTAAMQERDQIRENSRKQMNTTRQEQFLLEREMYISTLPGKELIDPVDLPSIWFGEILQIFSHHYNGNTYKLVKLKFLSTEPPLRAEPHYYYDNSKRTPCVSIFDINSLHDNAFEHPTCNGHVHYLFSNLGYTELSRFVPH